MLSDCCPVCLSVCPVCNVGVLWPNSWMDQDETWHGGRPRPRPHCVRLRPSSSSTKGESSPILAHICCGQTAGWIKVLLGREVGIGPGHIVLDGDPPPPPQGHNRHGPNGRPAQLLLSTCFHCETLCQSDLCYGPALVCLSVCPSQASVLLKQLTYLNTIITMESSFLTGFNRFDWAKAAFYRLI